MTKIADCIECGTTHNGWVRISKLKRPLGAQMLAKRAIRSGKRYHGMTDGHYYTYPNSLNGWFASSKGRQLIHKGGKP